ncbi:MAG: hypothetical protein PVJ27_09360 [Candidatus Brocadiaceae bacterium]
MIYRPGKAERLWDSWLFEWEGVVHLFYLASHHGEGRVGHCTSTDLVHWQRHEDLVLRHWPLTGMVIRHEGRFLMPLGEEVEQMQTTTFYVSDDLFAWRRLPPDEYRLRPRGPHYATGPDAWRPSAWWRDPFVFLHEEDGHYHALVCAAAPECDPDHTGALLAHVRTRDFRRWEYLPPLDGPTGLFYHTEVPDLFVHEGRYYVLFSTGTMFGLRIHTPSRRDTIGTYYMVGEALEGPYRLPDECLLVGAGHGLGGPYVGRSIVLGGDRLLYHQVRDKSGVGGLSASWGAPKRLTVGAGGELTAQYWPGLEALETGDLPAAPDEESPGWEQSASGWHGRAEAAGVSHVMLKEAADLHVRVNVTPVSGGRCGLVLRSADGRGVLVSLELDLGQVAIGVARHHEIAGWGGYRLGFIPGASVHDDRDVIDTFRCSLEDGRAYSLRVLARAEHFEVYLDERWVFTTVIPEAPPAGDAALYVERGEAHFADFHAGALPPLERTECVGGHRPEE